MCPPRLSGTFERQEAFEASPSSPERLRDNVCVSGMSPVKRVPHPMSQFKVGSLQMSPKAARALLTYPPPKGSREVKLTSKVKGYNQYAKYPPKTQLQDEGLSGNE